MSERRLNQAFFDGFLEEHTEIINEIWEENKALKKRLRKYTNELPIINSNYEKMIRYWAQTAHAEDSFPIEIGCAYNFKVEVMEIRGKGRLLLAYGDTWEEAKQIVQIFMDDYLIQRPVDCKYKVNVLRNNEKDKVKREQIFQYLFDFEDYYK